MMSYSEIMNRLKKLNEYICAQDLAAKEIVLLIDILLEDMRDEPKDQTEIYTGC